MKQLFTNPLLNWDAHKNHRPMPWKGEKDPYKIWLSEIILQQTRVTQGWAYYTQFISHYPTVVDLANAQDKEVFKLWEGLGYYNRCKNLLTTARTIVHEHKGQFPSTYEGLLTLKGIGPYTAAAIASFAYNLPYAVVDGNVFRVLSRFYGIETPTDTKEGIVLYNALAKENLAMHAAGKYNQAIMDFGATICKPAKPNCASCDLQKNCVAFQKNKVNLLPIKLKRIQKKKRHFDFFCFHHDKKWLIQKRVQGDIWDSLYQFYVVENDKTVPLNVAYLNAILTDQLGIPASNFTIQLKEGRNNPVFKQQLTHQTIEARFIQVELKKRPAVFSKSLWVSAKDFVKYPFPKIIHSYFANDYLNKRT